MEHLPFIQKEEIDSAIEIIKKQFASFKGCELHSLSYMPDEECNNADNIEWMNDLRTEDNKEAFTQCIAFKSSFRSPEKRRRCMGGERRIHLVMVACTGVKAENGI